MSLIVDAIKKIEELAKPEIIDIESRKYSSKSLFPVVNPLQEDITLHTLTGLIDYIKTNPDRLNIGENTIIIGDHAHVCLVGTVFGEFKQRETYVSVKLVIDDFPWGRKLEHEDFIIKLQSMFVQCETAKKILSIVGNLKDERVTTVNDDGITQQVTAKAGVARVVNVDLPNPVELTPFRTFMEADQVKSRFVFRMHAGRDGALPTCALHEADGGRWKLDAIQSVKKWLSDQLSGCGDFNVRILA